jgi:homospermidine synthase
MAASAVPIVMIGFGSIGQGTLPLIERHFDYDKTRFTVIDPQVKHKELLDERGIRFIQQGLTRDNYREILTPLLTEGGGQGFCVNVSVDTSSVDIMELCRELKCFYIDTVNEPWAGFYFDKSKGPAARTNYALREVTLEARRRNPGGTTAVSCCGANPGMVSWFVKQALVDIARDTGVQHDEPQSREDWARLMQRLGVKGVHIAERDTQRAKSEKPMGVFVNTWSVEGFVSEGMQPAELGWGTHETWRPENSGTLGPTRRPSTCCSPAPTPACAPGARRRAAIRLPGHPQRVDLDRGLLHRARGGSGRVPPDLPLRLPSRQRGGALAPRDVRQCRQGPGGAPHPGRERDRGRHRRARRPPLRPCKNAYWYGSQLSIEETRRIAPTRTPRGFR